VKADCAVSTATFLGSSPPPLPPYRDAVDTVPDDEVVLFVRRPALLLALAQSFRPLAPRLFDPDVHLVNPLGARTQAFVLRSSHCV
jgi:hypothetical protein